MILQHRIGTDTANTLGAVRFGCGASSLRISRQHRGRTSGAYAPPVDHALHSRVETLIGSGVTSSNAVAGGFTSARCWTVVLDDGQRAFVKVATDDESAEGNRTEALVLKTAASDPMPRLIGVSDDGAILATDDLSHADWSVQNFDADFWGTVATIGSLQAPDTLHRSYQGDGREWWSIVAADDRFAPAVGLDPQWFHAALPKLIDASRAADTTGSQLVHGDLAPGNWCRDTGSAWRFVDWGSAHLGNPIVDDAIAAVRVTRELSTPTWSPRLHDHPEFAAFIGGRFAAELLDVDWGTAPDRARTERIHDIRASCRLASALLGLPSRTFSNHIN